jgi:glycosidase
MARPSRWMIWALFASLATSLALSPHASPAYAGAADCNIQWADALHDTFSTSYRSVVGPTTPNTTVKLRLRVAQGDLTSARVRIWNDRTNTQTYTAMAWDGAFDTDPTTYDWWFADIPVGSQPTILYYLFEMNDAGNGSCAADQDFYVDDEIKFYGGGTGAVSDAYDDTRSFQTTVYDPAFSVPSWMQRGSVYQIFPDRFRDGNSANNPASGRFFYNEAGGTITRSGQSNWNYTMCDPRGVQAPPFSCPNHYSDNFYGGDLKGITDKINQGYFDNLGVTVLYLNPIFRSPSNHKYDTADFLTIDPDFGTLADFQSMVAAANAHGIKVVLDGVFNHVASDSKYFDRYSRYDAAGNLTSPGGAGANDGSGACEATGSSFRSWFYIPDIGKPGRDGNPDSGPLALCAVSQTYEAWYGYSSLPKMQANSTQVRTLIWSNGLSSVGPYWTQQGASGWRFDVGADVDPGLTNEDPANPNSYWEGYRAAVRNSAVTGKSDTLMLGEEWGDASAWLLGSEWDSVMNYRYRSAVMSWLFTGCVAGSGCSGGAFEDNDSNAFSSSGAISAITPSQFNARLRSIQEDYPPAAFKAMMNLEGSHDTNRIRFLLKKANNDSDSAAVQRMKEMWIFAYTYAGAPTVYYGDEVGLTHDGVWDGSRWQDDPYNRVPFPWDDTPGSYGADTSNLLPHLRKMASIRLSYRALQDGDVQHGLIINDAQKLYGFARTNGTQTALIALNRDNASHTATFTGLNAAPYSLPNGTVLVDALNGGTVTVTGGAVTVTVNSNWGVVLLQQTAVESPAVAGGRTKVASGANNILSWNPVVTDTAAGRELAITYEIYRGSTAGFTPSAANRIATISAPAFGGTSAGKITYTHVNAPAGSFYKVRAINAGGKFSTTPGF